jgi:nitrogen PTS system EIIA component
MDVATGTFDDGEFPFAVRDVPPTASNPELVIRFLIGELVRSREIAAERGEEIVELALKREELGSTAIGRGVAVPHASTSWECEPVAIAGRLASPFDWGAVDGEPVRLVLLHVGPASAPGAQLRQLERFAKYLLH